MVSQPYVSMTLAVSKEFGVPVENRPQVPPLRRPPVDHRGRGQYSIEPDASAASYFFALAAVLGGTVAVEGLGASSHQGDLWPFVDVLEFMGCTVAREPGRN